MVAIQDRGLAEVVKRQEDHVSTFGTSDPKQGLGNKIEYLSKTIAIKIDFMCSRHPPG